MSKAEFERTEDVYTYVYLHDCAKWSLEQGNACGNSSFYSTMSTLVFCAFCLEAYLNHIGSKLLPKWSDLERLSSKEKLYKIRDHAKISFDPDRPPFQSFFTLFEYRDALAHGKSETLQEPNPTHRKARPMRLDPADDLRWRDDLKLPWRDQTTPDKAKQLFTDMEDIITMLHKAVGFGDVPFKHGLKYGGTRGPNKGPAEQA